MRVSRFWLTAVSAVALSSCGLGAPAYPTFGQAAYRIEGTAATTDGRTVPTVVYRDGPKMRVETVVGNNTHAIIVNDQATNAAYVLTPTSAPATVATTATTATTTAATPAASTTTTVATARAPAPAVQVLGVATRVADSDAPQPMDASWAALGKDNARAGKSCEVAGEHGNEWTPRENTQGVERVACITSDGIVLRLTESAHVLFEATRVERGPQSPSLFGVPPGYQIIDPTTVAQQVGDTMQHLDSVTGAGAAPAPPTPAHP